VEGIRNKDQLDKVVPFQLIPSLIKMVKVHLDFQKRNGIGAHEVLLQSIIKIFNNISVIGLVKNAGMEKNCYLNLSALP
jgi:hypothetical protein